MEEKKYIKCKALTVKQPYAEKIARGIKTIEVRSKKTKHRGETIITASKDRRSDYLTGCLICTVDIYDIKPVSEFTPDDWDKTCIPEDKRPKKGYGWLLKDAKRLVEYPASGQLGIWNLTINEEEFIHYPPTSVNPLPEYKGNSIRNGIIIIIISLIIIGFISYYLIIWLYNLLTI